MKNEEMWVYAEGMVHLSVCVPAGQDAKEVARVANVVKPTGVTPWQTTEPSFRDGLPNPTDCNEHEGRQHWLLTC